MNNIEYWKKREEAKASKQFKKADLLEIALKEQYEIALKEINKKITYFYEKYAKDNDMTYKEATMFLNGKEYSRWRKTLEGYINDIEYTDDELLKLELNTLAMKSRITRLDNLKSDISVELNKLYKNQLESTTELLNDIVKGTYYETIYQVQVFKGIGHAFGKLDKKTVNSILEYPWSGDRFSSRIWKNKDKLVNTLKQELTQKFIQGKDVRSTAKAIADKMNTSYKNACTLVQTESAYIAGEATARGYEATGVEKYQLLITLDIKTSSICRELDETEVYDLKDKIISVNYPPFHCNCRTTTIPYFEDEEGTKRVAKKPGGKTYYVSSNTTYRDWYNKYVKNDSAAVITEKKIKNKPSDKKQFEDYREVLGKEVPRSFDKFQELKYNNVNEWENIKNKFEPEFIKKDFKDIPSFHENSSDLLTRKWYKWHDENIPKLIDKTKPIEDQAKQAHNLRNTYRTQARDLMKDQEERKTLDIEHPNIAFDTLVESKIKRKNMNREEAIKDILKTATKTNKKINKSLGLE